MKTVKVGEISTQLRGVSYKKADAKSASGEGLIPVLRANNISDGEVLLDDLVYVPKSLVKHKQLMRKGDVLIAASSGSLSVVGKAATVRDNLEAGFGAFCKVLRPNSVKVFPPYFAHFFQTSFYRHVISSLAAGANINNLRNEHLNELEVPLPPLEEQKRIAAILDSADALRTKRRQALAKLDTLLQSTFLTMFGDPVTNPMGWDVQTIKQSGTEVQIGPFGSLLHKEDYIDGGIPLINPKHIKEGKIVSSTKETVPVSKAEELSNYKLLNGDIVMGRRGEMGRCAIVDVNSEGFLCGTGSLIIRPNIDLLNSFYLYMVLSSVSMRVYLEKVAWGVTMANLNRSKIENLSIPIPSLDVQEYFTRSVKLIEEMKARNAIGLVGLDDLIESLQQRVFRGEL